MSARRSLLLLLTVLWQWPSVVLLQGGGAMMPLAFMETRSSALRGLLPLVVVLALLLSGCGTIKAYEGPELPKSEISVIDADYGHGLMLAFFGILPIPVSFRHGTNVLIVDGHKGIRAPYHILPGQHTARVLYIRNAPVDLCSLFGCFFEYRAILTIKFTTEAGHEYRIPAERRGERNWIWVEDITSGKVVAGEKPPDDKGEGKNSATPPEQP